MNIFNKLMPKRQESVNECDVHKSPSSHIPDSMLSYVANNTENLNLFEAGKTSLKKLIFIDCFFEKFVFLCVSVFLKKLPKNEKHYHKQKIL